MIATLVKPLVAAESVRPGIVITVPAGAVVEFHSRGRSVGLVGLKWNEKNLVANLQDLLSACSPGDVANAAWAGL